MNYKEEPHTRANHKKGGYILVDFDRTLATYTTWEQMGPTLGDPIPAMVERVRRWLAAGEDVRIFTARAAPNNPRLELDTAAIRDWTRTHVGQALEVTNQKDFMCKAIWDDIATTVEANTGWRWSASTESQPDPLNHEEEMRLTGYGVDPESKLTDEDTKSMMVKLAENRGMVSQYDDNFVNPPKLVPNPLKKG